jgi:copper chaperone CopZ
MMNSTPRTFVGATSVQVRGMTGPHSGRAVVAAVSQVEGVDGVTVDLLTGLVTICVGRPTDRSDIAAVIRDAGYTPVP